MNENLQKLNEAKDKYFETEKNVMTGASWKGFAFLWLIIAGAFFTWNIYLIYQGVTSPKEVASNKEVTVEKEKTLTEDVVQEQVAEEKPVEIVEETDSTEEIETGYNLFLDIDCVENWFFNKDDIDIYIDGEKVGHLLHGFEFTGLYRLSEGDHEVKLSSSSTYTKNIAIDKDATLKFGVTVDFSELVISDYSYTEGITTDLDVFAAIPGTYYGVDGCGLVLFNDGSAEIYYDSHKSKYTGCYWLYRDGRFFLWLTYPECLTYSNIDTASIGRITIKSDDHLSWKDEDYIRVSDETVALSVSEYAEILKIGKETENIVDVVSAINNIGTVDINSGDSVAKARDLYEKLGEDDKKKIENYSDLIKAEIEYNNLEKVDIENAIDGIGKVNAKSESKIKEAREKYNAASENVKNSISNYDKLVQAETKLAVKNVKRVEKLIKKVKPENLTLSDESKVNLAQTEYNRLSKEEKELVKNYQVLLDAKDKISKLKREEQERIAKEKHQKRDAALAKLTKKEDEVAKTTYYMPSTFPQYLNSRTYALPYLAVKGAQVSLKIKLVYYGDSWIFWDKVIFAVDDDRYNKTFGSFDVAHDVDNSAKVVEHIDYDAGTSDITMLEKIADSDKTTVRFQGDNYKYDLTMSAADKKAIGELMDAYKILKNVD